MNNICIYVNAVPTQVFHLDMGTSIEGSDNGGIGNFYRTLYSTTDKAESDSSRTTILSQVVQNLVTLCCSISEYPYIRYSKTHSGPSIVAQDFQVCINYISSEVVIGLENVDVIIITPVFLSLEFVYFFF